MNIQERFNQFDSEYINFDAVQGKRSNRPDLHASCVGESIGENPAGQGAAERNRGIYENEI